MLQEGARTREGEGETFLIWKEGERDFRECRSGLRARRRSTDIEEKQLWRRWVGFLY